MVRRLHYRLFLLLILRLFGFCPCPGQDLGSIGSSKPFHASGALGLNQVLYWSDAVDQHREPYTYYATGNLNLSLYGWQVPFSFSVSDQQTHFQQPFNQYSIHPTYKAVTGHFGYTSISYSPYTLNGHLFLGAAVDVIPQQKKWSVQTMYGRLLKAVEPDSLDPNNEPAFKRMGYALKTRYGDETDHIEFILFHAQDQYGSIHMYPNMQLAPMENLVTSLGASKQLFRLWLVKAEVASSALTRDTRLPEQPGSHLQDRLPLFTPRLSSSYYTAAKTSIDYRRQSWQAGIGYERIDPGYRTLGAYYFNNDLENITLNASASLIEGKINLTTSAGLQHDNLDGSKISAMHRTVGSVNLNATPTERLNLVASYSNFQTYTNIRPQFQEINELTPYDNLDTLNFTQLSQNATLSTIYQLQSDENSHQQLMLNLVVQDAADTQGDVPQNSGMRFYTANAGYTMQSQARHYSLSILFNTSINSSASMSSRIFGPTASLTRNFGDKFRTTFSTSYNNTYSDGIRVNAILNVRLNSSLTLHHHNFTLSLIALRRQTPSESAQATFTEFTGMVGYGWKLEKDTGY